MEMIAVRPPHEDLNESIFKIREDLERAGLNPNHAVIEPGITQPDGSKIYHVSVQTARLEK